MKKVAVSIAALAVALVGGVLPANATDGKASRAGQDIKLWDSGLGGCQAPGYTWGTNGAYASVHIDDWVKWNSKTSFSVVHSYADAENLGCVNGYRYSGGTRRLISSWTVNGQGIGSCSIGIGGNCTISDTRAQDGYDTGTLSNTTGAISTRAGGGNVYATGTAAGAINNYTHSASARFSANGLTTIANSSNYAYRGF
jgi:hypothetical protein